MSDTDLGVLAVTTTRMREDLVHMYDSLDVSSWTHLKTKKPEQN